MFILLEYVTCMVLVAGAVAAVLAVGWACVGLVQVLHKGALQIIRLLSRSSLPALGSSAPLFKQGHNLVAVKISTAQKHPRLALSLRHARGPLVGGLKYGHWADLSLTNAIPARTGK
jgi:hypothetical protein